MQLVRRTGTKMASDGGEYEPSTDVTSMLSAGEINYRIDPNTCALNRKGYAREQITFQMAPPKGERSKME